jgi:hypothetical protein
MKYMSQSIPWVPIPPPVGGKNVANAQQWGQNNGTKSTPMWTYIDANAGGLGDKI